MPWGGVGSHPGGGGCASHHLYGGRCNIKYKYACVLAGALTRPGKKRHMQALSCSSLSVHATSHTFPHPFPLPYTPTAMTPTLTSTCCPSKTPEYSDLCWLAMTSGPSLISSGQHWRSRGRGVMVTQAAINSEAADRDMLVLRLQSASDKQRGGRVMEGGWYKRHIYFRILKQAAAA